MDDVWIILISCSCTWDKLRSQLHRFKAVAWLKTIPCLWICLCVTENIYFITVVYTFVGRSWVRKELAESRSLTACFVKVEISLILLENPDLVGCENSLWESQVTRLLSYDEGKPVCGPRTETAATPSCARRPNSPCCYSRTLRCTLSLHIYFGFEDPILLSLLEALMLKTTFLQSWQMLYWVRTAQQLRQENRVWPNRNYQRG